MKRRIQLILIITVLVALSVFGIWLRYVVNASRFPDAPWWSNFFK